MSKKHRGTFVEIIRVSNGYAVYDFNIKQYDVAADRKAIPLAVFANKGELFKWLETMWDDVPYDELWRQEQP